jgi:hypothetical protein
MTTSKLNQFTRSGGRIFDNADGALDDFRRGIPEALLLQSIDALGARSLAPPSAVDVVDANLKLLEQESLTAPAVLAEHLADERALCALLQRIESTQSMPMLISCVLAVAPRGGCRVREVLTRRMAQLAHSPTLLDGGPSNRTASAYCLVAYALLLVDADATDAADALVSMLAHPSVGVRRDAAGAAAQVYDSNVRTRAMLNLGKMSSTVLQSNDTDVFVRAVPLLLRTNSSNVYERCDSLLRTGAPHIVGDVIRGLVTVGTGQSFSLMLRAFDRSASLETAFALLPSIWELCAPAVIRSRMESAFLSPAPSLRYGGGAILFKLGRSEELTRVVDEALLIEPDPLVQTLLRKYLAIV